MGVLCSLQIGLHIQGGDYILVNGQGLLVVRRLFSEFLRGEALVPCSNFSYAVLFNTSFRLFAETFCNKVMCFATQENTSHMTINDVVNLDTFVTQ